MLVSSWLTASIILLAICEYFIPVDYLYLRCSVLVSSWFTASIVLLVTHVYVLAVDICTALRDAIGDFCRIFSFQAISYLYRSLPLYSWLVSML